MSFEDDLMRFAAKIERQEREIFEGVVDLAHESIQTGSPVTGSPGQPVDTGALRDSWQKWYASPTEAHITTNLDYAIHVEDNVRGVVFKNHGPFSVALTVAGFQRIVDVVTRRVTGSGK